MQKIEFDTINNAALSCIDTLPPLLLPNGKQKGDEYVTLNPTRNDHKRGSFKINAKTGVWADFATGDKGGDLISLYEYLYRLQPKDAAIALSDHLGISRQISARNKHDDRDVFIQLNPVPGNAPEPPPTHPKLGAYSTCWTYRDADGALLGYMCRFETDTGKQFSPLTFHKHKNGSQQWRWKGFKEPRPLYGLDSFTAARPDTPVLLVEGEKCVDAAQAVLSDMVILTWPGGSNAAGKADFTPLKNRTVTLWPDNDQPGLLAMNRIAKILKGLGATVKTLVPPGDKPVKWDIADAIDESWSEQDILTFIQSGQSINSDDDHFWAVRKQKSGITIKISQSRLRSFLESRGFRKLYTSGSQQSMFVRIEDNIIEESSHERMKDAVLSYIQSLPDSLTNTEGNTILREDIMEAVERGAAAYFGRDKLEFLKAVDTCFQEDTAEVAHIYYKNGFIRVTRDADTFHQYSDLTGLVWRNRIIDRNYLAVDITQGEFERFLDNVCGKNDDRRMGIESAIGYLLHRYKNRSLAKAVILVDERISDTPEGRTGKSLIAEALGHMSNTTVIDGKSFRFDSQFAFQNIGLDTDIVVFDDVGAKFHFQNMFHMITGGLSCEQKNKPRIKLSFEESPKYLITSNYVVPGEGGSADARKTEYELSLYYSKDFSPRDEFGHNLFDDWARDEWALFDQYMIHCIQSYMLYGLRESTPINLGRRKLLQQTSPEFVEWIDTTFMEGDEVNPAVLETFYNKNELRKQFTEEFEYAEKQLTPNKFTKWIKLFALYTNLVIEDSNRRVESRQVRGIIFHRKE